MPIYYACLLNKDNKVVFGAASNDNSGRNMQDQVEK